MVNVFVRDLDLGVVDHLDDRRLEVVADGLPLFGGAQLAIDTTLVSFGRMARFEEEPRDGVALLKARRRKARTCPELTGQGGRARLVLVGETGGRWSNETASFLSSLAHAKSSARMCLGSLASQVGFNAQLCCCSGVRTVSARFARFSRGRWRCPNVHDVVRDHRFG